MAELKSTLLDLAHELASDPGHPEVQLLKEELRLAEAKRPYATHLSAYGRLHIPDLLQTESWARAALTVRRADPEMVDKGWALRRGRQELMHKVPQVFFIGEAALRGAALELDSRPNHLEIHQAQLAYLLEQQAARPALSVRALPGFGERIVQLSYHRAARLRGRPVPEFVVLQGARGRVGVYSSGLVEPVAEPAGILRDKPKDRILEQLSAMAALALSPDDTVAYVTELMSGTIELSVT